MPRRVVLHVGAMKTGTTFLQSVLDVHRAALAAAGTTYPETSVHAVRALLGNDGSSEPDPSRWRELAASTDGDLLVSMEFMSFAGPQQVARLLEPFAGDRVEVVVGVRDQRRTLGAQWQTYCRNRGLLPWGDWLRAIRGEGDDDAPGARRARRAWDRAQRVPGVLDRWSDSGADRLAVLTVPPSGTDPLVLWDRFSRAARLPAIDVDLAGVRSNPSLGLGSTELLRRMNPHLVDLRPWPYRQAVRDLARAVLVPRRPQESAIVPDGVAVRRALEANARVRERLAAGRSAEPAVEVVGEETDLPVAGEVGPVDADQPASVCDDAEVEAAARDAHRHLTGADAPSGLGPDDLVRRVAGSLQEAARR
ncbi:hypothetical protein [Nocardioides sp. CFH 31398]|uniref:hypothetical protein n=1 Tax=Nocardioides sp. CFH 31398 TaxID=2919579 RepID=UPI001F070B16|nr:hypothetical protein [Nocardioides sp. CFH 31398]MCH1866457.1 hypothetical protein [Nocardioides sp. CFH 31398]